MEHTFPASSYDYVKTKAQDSDATHPTQRRRPPVSTHDPCLDRGSKSKVNPPECRERSGSFSAPSSAMEELLRPQIVIKPHPSKLTVKPRSLQPLMLLPREFLRLSFLALSSPYGSFEPSPAFESNIKILDLESRVGSRPVVLIARLESNKTVYAIERQANTLYTLCHLGSWVDLEQLSNLATVACHTLIRKLPPNSAPDLIAAVPLTTPQISHTNKKRKLAIESIQSLVKKPARSRSLSLRPQAGDVSSISPASQGSNAPDAENAAAAPDTPSSATPALGPNVTPQIDVVQDEDAALSVPNAERIFETIRNQYFEALYHSMGSLAYFAKGPLSRARAAFHLEGDSPLEMRDLIDFLKSLVMTTVQIDKKYRETIPKIQSEMKHIDQDSDAEPGQGKGKPRKRKVKKVKLGKDGLYPNEDDHVRRWWTIYKPSLRGDDESTTKSTEQQSNRLQTSLLRSRETQLQMIIILEILSLEPLIVSKDANDSQLPGEHPAGEPSESPKTTPIKKRNKHNLPLLLDVHADRLCIWQSTALDEIHAVNESQAGLRQELQNSFKPTSDPLKDFCVDIIMQFFAARLPDYCDSINRKLGGPVMMPPPKSNEKKAEPPSKAKSKPGTAAKRPASRRSQTLENFLSKETEKNRRSMSRGPGGVIALMRSATTPTIPLLKREASEPLSLAGIPKTDTGASREKHRSSLGLPSSKRKAETKEKKDAFVRAELQDAITSLRRPNRAVVEKDMTETDERRAVTGLSQLKKSKKPTQYQKAPHIVKATPVGSRFRDILTKGRGSGSASLDRFDAIAEEPMLPSSSIVPSSAPRKRDRDTAFENEQPAHDASAAEPIMATPARPSSTNFLSAPQPDEATLLASSPLIPRKFSQPSFLSKTQSATLGHEDSGIGLPSSPSGPEILAETPIKARQSKPMTSTGPYITVTPMKKITPQTNEEETNPKKKMTIFERLGWDDEYDDLV
ncbi:DNA replication regulator SLD3-domain-containing protein [Xylaria intraflava]|nr:DNA replication regulator SLD3-domain-containing protein [Xylaria intraflava]